ncbi:hypothetical protein [Rhodohalobacter sp.]|uniref:hypothetical protein n=1 Tax=Rhodohalobacter sp. TaxID=1974210 RepID=UPI0035645507
MIQLKLKAIISLVFVLFMLFTVSSINGDIKVSLTGQDTFANETRNMDWTGNCSSYENCNNPYGTCNESGAQYQDCLLVCTVSRNWVYCDGCEDCEGED